MRFITSLLTCLLLSGCSDSPTDTYQTYQSRLQNVHEFKLAPLQPLKPIHVKSQWQSKQTVTFSLLELGKINHCKLSQFIAHHNSQLGKVAPQSEQVKYQINFIQQAPECIKQLDKNRIQTELIAIVKQKRVDLYGQFKHMLLAEPEARSLFKLGDSLDMNESAGLNDTLEALTILASLDQQIKDLAFNSITPDSITEALAKLNRTQFTSQLITSMQQQVHLNQQLTASLDKIDLETLCPIGKNHQQATIFANVFSQFYLKQLQGYQAQLTKQFRQLEPYLTRLWRNEHNQLISPALVRLIGSETEPNLEQRLSTSAKQHVQWWQTFFKQCNISPK
ncbi:DUF3080 family protein [Pseudoalteromonas ulvae]|uniref:DUF3080 domain-containing protein n=1 Tax=Pseudoalteromonas ulvae TaxID=107327 RepID=A0A244CMN9_PSEDV|nr:DUF3080 family protein [Pseudoalteromonas ulvae]OUL56862.1 hypothetical protein B1199_15955 [Pseudoalteromonas ulvae]